MAAFTSSSRSNYSKNYFAKVRSRPRLCENVRDIDPNGTAHHFGNASVKTSALSPHFGLVSGVKQIAITTDILDFAFSHSLGHKRSFNSTGDNAGIPGARNNHGGFPVTRSLVG